MAFKKIIHIVCVGTLCFGFFARGEPPTVPEWCPNPAIKDRWINIYIHGTIRPYASLSDALKMFHNRTEKSSCAYATRSMRGDQFFQQTQAIQDIGLHRIGKRVIPYTDAAYLFATLYEKVTQLTDPTSAPTLHYTFGWNGLLSMKARQKAAHRLCVELSALTQHLAHTGYIPHVRIVGYSHGGNIALCLAQAVQTLKLSMYIDELILIATPLYHETMRYAASPIFGTIYNFYSRRDHIQTMDFVSSRNHALASHKFRNFGSFKVPQKVAQVRLCLYKPNHPRAARHFAKFHPSHTELFHFGWSSYGYRQKLPLYPLPVASILPSLIVMLRELGLAGQIVDMDLYPNNAQVIIIAKRGQCFMQPWLSLTTFEQLEEHALTQSPPPNYRELYRQRVREIQQQSRQHKNARLRLKERARHLKFTAVQPAAIVQSNRPS